MKRAVRPPPRPAPAPARDLDEVRALADLLREYGLCEVEVERGGERIRLRAPDGSAPAAAERVAAASPPPAPPAPAVEENVSYITSPFVGTFYRAPSPGAPAYAEVGQVVRKGQVLCLIEAMKLMNEIEAEVDGRLLGVLVQSGEPVEYGEPLFKIGPV